MKGVKLVGYMDMAQFKIHPWVGGLRITGAFLFMLFLPK